MSIRSRPVQADIIQFSGSDLTASFAMKFFVFIGTLLVASTLALAQSSGGGAGGQAGAGFSLGGGFGGGSGFGRRK